VKIARKWHLWLVIGLQSEWLPGSFGPPAVWLYSGGPRLRLVHPHSGFTAPNARARMLEAI